MNTDHISVMREEKVCDFFLRDTKGWDIEKVQAIFHESDARLVLATRIPQNQVMDRLT